MYTGEREKCFVDAKFDQMIFAFIYRTGKCSHCSRISISILEEQFINIKIFYASSPLFLWFNFCGQNINQKYNNK